MDSGRMGKEGWEMVAQGLLEQVGRVGGDAEKRHEWVMDLAILAARAVVEGNRFTYEVYRGVLEKLGEGGLIEEVGKEMFVRRF